MYDKLIEAMVEIEEQEAIQIAENLVAAGNDPMEILNAGTAAMKKVGEKFEAGEYFLPQLIMSGEILKRVSGIVKPLIQGETTKETMGRVLMGTVAGDIHDLGKDIVSFLLDVNGFEVKDIGVDVSMEAFVEEIRAFQPQVVGLSGLLTVAYESMKKTVDAIKEAGLRDDLKIMIGGAQASEKIAEFAGADAFGKDAFEGVSLAKQWICGE